MTLDSHGEGSDKEAAKVGDDVSKDCECMSNIARLWADDAPTEGQLGGDPSLRQADHIMSSAGDAERA